MKTLVLMIDHVRCEFEAGKVFLAPVALSQVNLTFVDWYKKNRNEIEHYKELTTQNNLINTER